MKCLCFLFLLAASPIIVLSQTVTGPPGLTVEKKEWRMNPMAGGAGKVAFAYFGSAYGVRFLDQRQDVAHAQDARRHAVGMERLDRVCAWSKTRIEFLLGRLDGNSARHF